MDPVSRADRLAALLRQRLLERSRQGGVAGTKAGTDELAVDRIYPAAGVEARDERQLRRSVIQAILTDEFGPDLINEAGFQQIIERVLDAIEGDADASALIAQVTRDRAAG
jgi:hypothetical protein